MTNSAKLLSQSFTYDFSKTGGAVGTQITGIQIPNNASVIFVATRFYSLIILGGTISIGTATTPTLFGGPLGGPVSSGLVPGFGLPTGTTYRIMDNTLNVILTIAGGALPTGTMFTCYFQYYLFQ